MAETGKKYSTANDRALDDSIFPPVIEVLGRKHYKVPKRYGDNPHQAACLYVPVDVDCLVVGGAKDKRVAKGGLSMTNTRDVDRAYRILKYMHEDPACAVMKHINPAGVARSTEYTERDLRKCFEDAWAGDPRAAFGSAVAFTRPVDRETAEAMMDGKHYIEVVAAPGFEEGVMGMLENTVIGGKNVNGTIRVVEVENVERLPRFIGDEYRHMEICTLDDGSLFLQEPFLSRVRTKEDLTLVTKREPTDKEYSDAINAWYVCLGVRSNAVLFYRDGMALTVGTGEQERVGAIEQAIDKARKKGHSLKGSSLASDGFIPMRDNIDTCSEEGIPLVIQPGGSKGDRPVIEACNEYGIAMAYADERCFTH